jgi:hypothetical protein
VINLRWTYEMRYPKKTSEDLPRTEGGIEERMGEGGREEK